MTKSMIYGIVLAVSVFSILIYLLFQIEWLTEDKKYSLRSAPTKKDLLLRLPYWLPFVGLMLIIFDWVGMLAIRKVKLFIKFINHWNDLPDQ